MNLPLQSPPESICLLRLSAIGDVTHVLPTLRCLQAAWPACRISWIIGKTEAALVSDIGGVELIIFDKAKEIKAFFDLRRQLRGRRFDLLLNMQVSPRAALASLLVRAPLKLGYDRRRGKFLHNLVCNRQIPHVAEQHVLDSFLEFPKLLGLNIGEIRWEIPIPEAAKARIDELLGDDTPYLLINPCTSNRARNWRNWSVANYAAVIDATFESHSLRSVLTGGPNLLELTYAQQIVDHCRHKPLNLVGRTSLKEMAALCQGARAMISPDTGPAHIANAMGTPVIGLFATSNPLRTGPYNHRELTVNVYPQALQQELGKTVEEVKWGQRVRNPQAMDKIQVKDVLTRLNT